MQYVGSTSTPQGPVEDWPIVELDGVSWYVAPTYLAPVAKQDLFAACATWGCEIPSKRLVDAIWEAADLKIDRDLLARTPNDVANGASPFAFRDQRQKIEALIAGRPFRILAGTHKDFAWVSADRIDLYGWHSLAGVLKEKGATSHGKFYVDYSQGLRLVRKVEVDDITIPRIIAVP